MTIWFGNPKDRPMFPAGTTMPDYIGIELLEIGDDYITARMPVDHRTRQPAGLLHGGASVTLAETLGSMGAWYSIDPKKQDCVGLEINANHVRPVVAGRVIGTARPLHRGRSSQVWGIDILTPAGQRVCIARLTVAVIPAQPAAPTAGLY